MAETYLKNLADQVLARLQTDYAQSGPLSVSLIAQQARVGYAEALLALRGSSEDVFARLNNAPA